MLLILLWVCYKVLYLILDRERTLVIMPHANSIAYSRHTEASVVPRTLGYESVCIFAVLSWSCSQNTLQHSTKDITSSGSVSTIICFVYLSRSTVVSKTTKVIYNEAERLTNDQCKRLRGPHQRSIRSVASDDRTSSSSALSA